MKKANNIIDLRNYRLLREAADLKEKIGISEELKLAIQHLIQRLREHEPLIQN